MIEVHDLTVTYDGRDVLHKVTLTVPDGAHIALMGPSGCGKTTLLRVLAGLRAPDGGSVRVSPGRIACVFQEPRLLPWRTAAENVNAVLSDRTQTCRRRAHGSSGWSSARRRSSIPRRSPAACSSAWPLRARSRMTRPVLLLDEPFRALDAALRARVIACIAAETRGRTLVLATHDPADADALGCTVYAYAGGHVSLRRTVKCKTHQTHKRKTARSSERAVLRIRCSVA